MRRAAPPDAPAASTVVPSIPRRPVLSRQQSAQVGLVGQGGCQHVANEHRLRLQAAGLMLRRQDGLGRQAA